MLLIGFVNPMKTKLNAHTLTHMERMKLNSTHLFNYRRQIENEPLLINFQL